MEIELPAGGWTPRPYQRELWMALQGGCKRAVAVWHRRGGKDEVALNWTAVASHQRPGNYWHMLPEYGQGRKAIWEAINPHTGRRRIDEAFPNEIRKRTRDHEMMMEFHSGAIWNVVGSDNFNSLVGSPPVGVVFSEWALANPAAWAFIRPILAENGGWALFIYTPRGDNHGRTTFDLGCREDGWFAQKLTAEETGVFTPEQLKAELREYQAQFGADAGRAYYEQEYLCSFEGALMGAYYAAQMEQARKDGRITKVPYQPEFPVDTWWDLGMDDATAIWFVQYAGKEIHVVDHYENNGEALPHYVDVIKERVHSRGASVGEAILPHDARVRELSTGVTRDETIQKLGMKTRIAPNQPVVDGINAVRQLLARCWFDAERCAAGISALKSYRKVWDEDRRTFKTQPMHDWASHSADSFRTGVVTKVAAKDKRRPERLAPKIAMV